MVQKRTSVSRAIATFPYLDNQAVPMGCTFPASRLPIWNTGRTMSPLREEAAQVLVFLKNSELGLKRT